MCWIHGPFAPGDYNDVMVFCHALRQELGENERVEADDGYGGEDPNYVKTPGKVWHDSRQKPVRAHVRSRH